MGIALSVCYPLYLSIYPSTYLSMYLSRYLFIYFHKEKNLDWHIYSISILPTTSMFLYLSFFLYLYNRSVMDKIHSWKRKKEILEDSHTTLPIKKKKFLKCESNISNCQNNKYLKISPYPPPKCLEILYIFLGASSLYNLPCP